MLTEQLQLPKFASIVNQEAYCLERIAFRSTDVDVDDLQLLGNRVSTNDLGLTGARYERRCKTRPQNAA